MKVTISVDCRDANFADVMKRAVETVATGDSEGTYGLGPMGEYTIAYWPDGAQECQPCGGRGHVVVDEQQRRDEKHGLYPQHEDPAN